MAVAAVAVAAAGLALQIRGGMDAREDAQKIATRRRQAAEFEAAQLEQQAGQEIAVSHRTVFEEGRQGKLVQSRALALAAASGASASDPTIIKIVAGIASESTYRQNVALYQGEEKARQLRLAAAADRESGEIGAAGSIAQGRSIVTQAAGSALGTGSSMYARYGYNSPATRTQTPTSEFFYTGGTRDNPAYG